MTGQDETAVQGPKVESILNAVITREGGYVNHPADRGGPTKYGVTLRTLARWRGSPVTAEDVKNLRKPEAYQIFRQLYYLEPRLNLLPSRVRPLAVDCSVHHGASGAVSLIQRVLEATASRTGYAGRRDGIMGSKTAAAVESLRNAAGPVWVRDMIAAERRAFMLEIVAARPSQRVFLRGWLRRCNEFLSARYRLSETEITAIVENPDLPARTVRP